jgi:chemotaxis protein CheX
MTLISGVSDLLNNFITALKAVIPLEVTFHEPTSMDEPFNQHHIGVLIGMTGDTRGRFIIDGEDGSFKSLAASMFGMPLAGEMLESFAGELGNMVVGNLATSIALSGRNVDITIPAVLAGDSNIYGFHQAVQLPLTIENVGDFLILLMIEE